MTEEIQQTHTEHTLQKAPLDLALCRFSFRDVCFRVGFYSS